jgi:hypothetical protein
MQDLLDELEASRASRKRAWEILQEIRWVLKDTAGLDLPPPARKTIDLEGRIVKDGVPYTIQKRLCPLLPDFVEASLLKIIWSHDDSEFDTRVES